MSDSDYVDPEICPNCESETNKFVGQCDHCGFDRWRSQDTANDQEGR